MSTATAEPPTDIYDITEIANRVRAVAKTLVTEDEKAVDNLYCAKLQRLLVAILYAAWLPPENAENLAAPRSFLADANVGIYSTLRGKPLVPDVFLSVGVEVGEEWETDKEPRCYFVWEFGKPPDMVLEIVSNKVGNELGSKLQDYARAGIRYYVVYDAWLNLGTIPARVYELAGGGYRLRPDLLMPDLGLGLTLWEGTFEGLRGEWLRWTDINGEQLLTAQELADQETERANQEAERANQEAERADKEAARAQRLAAKLLELGLDADAI
jgi:hypothetical protein